MPAKSRYTLPQSGQRVVTGELMPGKPYQSKLGPYQEELYVLLAEGSSYRKIAESLNDKYGLGVSHNAIFSYVNAASRRDKRKRRFCDGLDEDIRESLLKQIALVWTHGSNAIEGNTLTLGETEQVLKLGLTISGRPLKDHEEAYGHAKAIDLLRQMSDGGPLDEDQVLTLHRAVMPKGPVDAMNQVGGWKKNYNGTTGVVDGKTKYMEYSSPSDVPALMKEWIKSFNKLRDSCGSEERAVDVYTWLHMSLVRIHPFFDGNGRIARLLANLPVLRGGSPPLLISPTSRGRYIEILWNCQNALGVLKKGEELLPDHAPVSEFKDLLRAECGTVIGLVTEAKETQAARAAK